MALKVKLTGLDTSTLPRYTNEELNALLRRIKKGDKAAREKFLTGNMRLVLSIVQRFKNTKAEADDMFQVGMVGLIKATDNFNVDLGVMFSTYAVPMIEGEIRRFVREGTALKVGRATRDMAYRAVQAREKLEKDGGKEATLSEIAEELSVPLREVVASLDAIAEPLSLYDTAFGDDEDSMLMDRIAAGQSEDELYNVLALRQAVEGLPDKEQEVVRLRYYEGRTQMEISAELDISQAQVSRLEKTAIDRLKTAF